MRPAAMLFALAASALALAGCGGGSSQADATTETDAATTPATTTTETTTTATDTTTTTTTTAPKPRTISIVVESGRPRGGIARPTVAKGDKVVVVVRTDAGEEVHLHGYDIEKPVTPGTPVRIPFTANLPGRFELELHHPDALLAVIEVKP
jgi:ABC-type Fe3+-hydroxamate transport system substrate-binding protein